MFKELKTKDNEHLLKTTYQNPAITDITLRIPIQKIIGQQNMNYNF